MAQNMSETKLPLAEVMGNSWNYCNHNPKAVALFAGLNYLVCTAAFYGWKTVWLWLILMVMYVLWGAFFRYYFNRKPYLVLRPLLISLVPSTKIVVLSVLLVTAFLLLPFAILFIPHLPPQFVEPYTAFLQSNMQTDNEVLNALVNLVMVLFSPLIFYRPMMAWISTLLGRSGSLRFAWSKTKGNYWEFLLLAVVIDLSVTFIYKAVLLLGGNVYVALLPLSVLIVYFNVVVAQIWQRFIIVDAA